MANIRNIIVNSDSVRAVLQNHEAVSEQSVQAATDDPVDQATLVAGLNNALVEIMDHEESADVLSSPPSKMASLLQSFLALLLQNPTRAHKKLVLLSHHQPYSLLDSQGPKLVSFLRLFLNGGRVYAWYWGHEHRCVIYDRHPDWKLAGRCIGHGGYPYFRDTSVLQKKNGQQQQGANGSTWYRVQGMKLNADASRVPGGLTVPGAIVLDGPNPYLGDEADQYGPHGYVTLEFEGDKLYETFYVPQPPGPTAVPIIMRREV